MLIGMNVGGGAGRTRTLRDAGVDAFRKRLFPDRVAIAAERVDPVFFDHDLRFLRVVDLPRDMALRFGALRILLAAAMAGLWDVIDDAVRFLRSTQHRPRMSGLAVGSALRLAAQVEDAFLFFSSGGGFANPSLDGGLPQLPLNRLELRSSSPIRCFKATINSRDRRFSSAKAAFSASIWVNYLPRVTWSRFRDRWLFSSAESFREQFRTIVRPPSVRQAGLFAEYGGRARHACKKFMGLLRNSFWVSCVDQQYPNFVYLITKSDRISSNVPDSFSRDSGVFEFRNSLFGSVGKLDIDEFGKSMITQMRLN